MRSETGSDKETLSAVETLMATKRAYSRCRSQPLLAGAQARYTGAADFHGKNVSQHVNEHRIVEACALLVETDKAVTEIMFEAGFQHGRPDPYQP
ncbi:hypothetical protein [Mycoplana rhizolycopersici]|uniref:Uncharacterized protein n=1 Tax=Mycoplana rhizolycopersici TaxID=2746702 RepID=A0ABX2QFN7_9HYPH|nr:hypothetical protein [Rhizobium rhizolycopersici]NVP55443.1 hypothetical protein [Rhizobium rhizolycopersici]